MTRSTITRLLAAVTIALLAAPAAFAQDQPAAGDDDPSVLNPVEPDFTLISLPTSMRLPLFKGALRVTHRFTRPLGEGDFGDLAADLFGLDSAAQIGLEFRFGIIPNGEVGIHRTSDRTIQFFSQYAVLRQSKVGLDVSAWASIEGLNNFKESHSPALGAIVSRKIGEIVAVYVEPLWVNNSNPLPAEVVDHNNTFMVGVGARVRIQPTLYIVAESAPRAAGYEPGVSHASFALEKRVGGHLFQINFSDSFATTMAQLSRGGPASKDWFIGFNITRKFY